MKRELTCIICPRGCRLSVDIDNNTVSVSGNACPKGEKYGIEECVHPTRTLTSVVRVENRENTMLSVKTAAPIPKERVFDAVEIIKKTTVKAPIRIGDKILKDIYGTDVVATKDVV